jgi:hypothetical protein
MLLQEISQILAAVGVSASQEEKILTTIRNIPASLEVIEEQKFHEPHPQEDLEALFDHPCQIVKETKESWTTFDGEKPLEPEIKEFLCMPIIRSFMHPRDQPSDSRRYAWHGRGGYTEWSK